MRHFENLPDEIKIHIFKYVTHPRNLALCCKIWSVIARDSQARSEWIIFNYGRAHAIFYAIKLGPSFINLSVAQAIIARRGILSRYLIQKLLMNYGTCDPKLIEFKIAHNIGQIDAERIKSIKEVPWASNLPISVFTYFLTEISNQLNSHDIYIKSNDMELFHFLTAGPHIISDAPKILKKNIDAIKDLILNNKFFPFPPRPSGKFCLPEEYPSKDGYENNRQLNVIARAILIHKDLVNMWKKIGYHEICKDVNNLVIQGSILILFPPIASADWIQPDTKAVNDRLVELIDLGFELNYSVIGDILYLFERKLDDIGEILVESFMQINKESRESFAYHCLIESLKIGRNLTKFYVWDFLYAFTKDISENLFMKALDHYLNNYTIIPNKHLSLPIKFYEWALINFGVDSQITERCFDDILSARVYIDLQLQQYPNMEIPIGMNKHVFQATCNIFKIYCNAKNFYKPSHLGIVSQCASMDILAPLFKHYLPALFNLQITFELPMIIEVINSANEHYQNTFSKLTAKINRDRHIIEEWNQTLHDILMNNSNNSNNSTIAFKNYLREFIEIS
ncbi:7773_t:CDS:1 [Scutellospora calospora]|uniref:7773_t:CDS:1 n=1 Tax=Scutellospora calospora TaxID=85575 RepID=A0ACA9M093_9GLOM|nr:7773_t:CDS:1 [Scutellospora calospora]